MKTIKQIREEYDSLVLDQVEVMPEEIMLAGKSLSQHSRIPSSKEMPAMLVFRRIQYRIFPNKQVVALYYSKMINKYLSIPFGPDGNVNLSEAVVVHDDLIEDWQSVNRKDKTDVLSQAAVNAYRRENPGSKLKTAVTEKNPTGKRAARRKSFCSRMGGMKKRLTSAKTARDPDSRINKALRRWNCEESFKERLQALREARGYNLGDFAADAASFIPGPIGSAASLYSAQRSLDRGDKVSAALDVAGAAPLAGYAAKLGKLGKLAKGAFASSKAAKAAKTVDVAAGMSKAGKAASTADKVATASKVASTVNKVEKTAKGANILRKGSRIAKGAKAVGAGLGAAAAAAGSLFDDPLKDAKKLGQDKAAQGRVKTGSASPKASDGYSPTVASKIRQAELARSKVQENKISDIRNMIDEGVSIMELPINGRTIKLNSSMAKRIVEVYDSVNTKNKKVVESMLNEDLDSFKKLLNFSIKV